VHPSDTCTKEYSVLLQGVTLTIIGMLVVFIILILLVFAMKALSAIVFRFFPEPEEPEMPASGGGSSEIAAAIAAAYMQRYKK
jgi:sodium pump decarboxylase gamma subunit